MTIAGETLPDSTARHAIATALDDTLIVEAAAGTGKTTELVGRIVTILAEGRAKVGEIVAVTFTEKAAGELKLRLRERLDVERTLALHDRVRRGRLDEALTALEEAHIGTIHAFCADLLRERPVEAGVDPLFQVLTEPAAERLFEEAFGRWLQDTLAAPGEGVRRALRRSAFGGNEGPVDRLRNAAYELTQWRDFTAPWARPDFERAAEIDAILPVLHELSDLTRRPASRNDPLSSGTEPVRRVSDEITLQQTFGDKGDRDYDGWEARLVDLSRDRALVYAKQGRGASYAEGVPRERAWTATQDLRGRLDRFRMDADADLAALLQQELRGAIARYETMKATAGALDFLDLLLLARNLVRDNAQVRTSFQSRFKRIFVDEFQDTDPLQAEILLLLAADDPGETDWRRARPVPGRLFLVGDPKQSIYRFRRADVAIYRQVCEHLQALGARLVHLNTSFRSVPEIQACVNSAFAPVMTGDEITLQAGYVPLAPHRPAMPNQPSLVALPVPSPYKGPFISAAAIDASLPDAVGAFVDWLVNQSGWLVTERTGSAPVPVAARHVCLLFRRFISFDADVTRPYVEALEARGIPHVLVGGRAFHEREEVEAIRAALAAVEWPDDELSVFATLRGPFFAIGDEELLEWAWRFGRRDGGSFRRSGFHPFRIPDVFNGDVPEDLERLRPIAGALAVLARLHRRRNYVPVAETLHDLLSATRAHVGFALRTGGEQALANVLHIAELARQYETNGGISFRGFVDELRVAADTAHASEAPILEEDSDGVRMMTVHKAKGLEFPVVLLVDLTCKLSRTDASRWIDPGGSLCALRLGGWTPHDLRVNGDIEVARDQAEGQRLAYVAATRARDLLVVPVIGDDVREGWLDPLMPAFYPAPSLRRTGTRAPGCPEFPSKDTVLERPDGDPAGASTVAPGMYRFSGGSPPQDRYSVVWWDPHVLALGARSAMGLRRDDLIAKDGDPAAVAARLAAHQDWSAARSATTAQARVPSVHVRTATDVAADRTLAGAFPPVPVDVIDLAPGRGRPFGPKFGTLVHATLATVALDADDRAVANVASTQARILLLPEEEAYAAAEVVVAALAHPIFNDVRAAAERGRCYREHPIVWCAPDGSLVEGTIDLAWEDERGITVLDFKTDRELSTDRERYERQLSIYCAALTASRAVLMKI
jgi:ATP-dependent helicase/nuclease subunit A